MPAVSKAIPHAFKKLYCLRRRLLVDAESHCAVHKTETRRDGKSNIRAFVAFRFAVWHIFPFVVHPVCEFFTFKELDIQSLIFLMRAVLKWHAPSF